MERTRVSRIESDAHLLPETFARFSGRVRADRETSFSNNQMSRSNVGYFETDVAPELCFDFQAQRLRISRYSGIRLNRSHKESSLF